jgi:hypothetical protein
MRITLKTHGGIAAAIKRKPASVDTSVLSNEEAQQWIQLVEAALASAPKSSPAVSARPDMMGYTLTIEGKSGAQTLKFRDGELTPALAALLSALRSAT